MPNYTWMYWNNQIGLDMNDMGNGWWQNHLQFRTNSGFNGDQTNRLTGSNGKSCRENHMRRKVKWQGLPLKKMSWGCAVPVVLVFKWITMVITPSGLPRETMGPLQKCYLLHPQVHCIHLVLWCFGHIFNWLSNITGWTLDDIGIHHL